MGRASIGFVIRNEHGQILLDGGMDIGMATVNQCEYSALICGLYNCQRLGATEVDVYSDSMLVVNQMNLNYRVCSRNLKDYHAEALKIVAEIGSVSFTWIPRKKNKYADKITRQVFEQGDMTCPGEIL